MNFKKFKDDVVKIEFIESCSSFGHHPMQLIAINSDDTMEMNALIGLNTQSVISRVKDYKSNDSKELFLSLDLPSCKGISNDYILAIHFKGDATKSTVIEYNLDTGIIVKETDNIDNEIVSTIIGYF